VTPVTVLLHIPQSHVTQLCNTEKNIKGSEIDNYYKLKTLELIKKINLILGLIQENLIENSIQDCLPYIPETDGLYHTTISLF